MATLYLGRPVDAPDAPPVAIKVIHEHLSEDWQFVRMFVDEALISVRLRHPNVVRVDELGEHQNVYYLVMEYVHGCSLAQLLTAMARQGRRMRPEIAVWVAQQVAAGLHAAHEMTGHDGAVLGVIHRDVSPQNVLLSVDGEVKLLDFGIAKARGRAERTEAGVIKGKIRYMAPEQAMGEEIDRRIDVYALGVVLWEMLTMRRYIEGRTEVEVLRKVQSPEPVPPSFRADGIDPRIDQAVLAAIAPPMDRRPPTAAHLYHMLDAAVPQGTVGPAHVAELLRLFVADEIEAAARVLPADVAAQVAARVRGPTPLPTDRGADVDDPTRVATLTRQLAQGAAAPSSAAPEEATRGAIPARVPRPEAATADEIPIDLDAPEELRRFDGDEDEATVEASGAELAAFLQSIRPPQAAAPAPQPSPSAPAAPGTAPAPAAAPPPAPARGGGDALRWVVRLALITLVAFALGAGIAVAWVRLIAR